VKIKVAFAHPHRKVR